MNKLRALINYLLDHRLVLATAESCTAGKIMTNLADEGHCGDCLYIGYVVYTKSAKIRELAVKESTIDKYGLTSEEVAKEMALGVFQHPEINVAIATTGITGNKSMNGIPPGTVCYAWAFKEQQNIKVYSETKVFPSDSKNLIKQAAHYALMRLENYHRLFIQNNS